MQGSSAVLWAVGAGPAGSRDQTFYGLSAEARAESTKLASALLAGNVLLHAPRHAAARSKRLPSFPPQPQGATVPTPLVVRARRRARDGRRDG